MSLSEKDVKKIAKLARIGISDSEVEIFKTELSKILDMVEQLKEVDTKDVEPLYSVADNILPLREDIAIVTSTAEEVLSNASEKEFNCFKVPKVIE